MAPTVSLEQLVYATRIMDTAAQHGVAAARTLRDWWVESDAKCDPQAFVLRPDVVLELAEEMIAEPSAYMRTCKLILPTALAMEGIRTTFLTEVVENNDIQFLSYTANLAIIRNENLCSTQQAGADLQRIWWP